MRRKDSHWQKYYEDDEDSDDFDNDYMSNYQYRNSNRTSATPRHNNNRNANKPCRFYLNGHCKKGAKCNMLHDPRARQTHNIQTPQINHRPLTSMANTLSPGNPFLQFLNPHQGQASNVRQSRLLVENPFEPHLTPAEVRAQKLTPCDDFLEGHCAAGSKCPLNHDMEQLRQIFPNAPVFNKRPKEASNPFLVNVIDDDEPQQRHASISSSSTASPFSRPGALISNVAHNHNTMAHRLGAPRMGLATQELFRASGALAQPQAVAFPAPRANFVGRVGQPANTNPFAQSNQSAFERLASQRHRDPFHRMRGDDIDVDNMSYEQLSALCEKNGNVSKGVNESTFSRFPTRRFQQKKKHSKEIVDVDAVDFEDDEPECAICKDAFENGDMLVSLPCFHSFHQECIRVWMKDNNTCPLCLRSVNEAKQ